MKRALEVLVAFSIASMFLISPVAAATSQGLEWGIELNDQYNFDITSETNGVNDLDAVIYFEVTGGLSTIPNILTDWSSIPKPTFTIQWANGTSLGWSALIFIFYGIATDCWVVPIGNYTLLGELYDADVFHNGTVFDTGSYWGMDVNDFLGNTVDIHVDYLKSDGFLAHWTVTTDNGTLVMTRQGIGFDIMGFIQDNLIVIAAVGVILVIAIVVCIKRK